MQHTPAWHRAATTARWTSVPLRPSVRPSSWSESRPTCFRFWETFSPCPDHSMCSSAVDTAVAQARGAPGGSRGRAARAPPFQYGFLVETETCISQHRHVSRHSLVFPVPCTEPEARPFLFLAPKTGSGRDVAAAPRAHKSPPSQASIRSGRSRLKPRHGGHGGRGLLRAGSGPGPGPSDTSAHFAKKHRV